MCCLWDSRISRTCCNVWSFILPWGSEEDNEAEKLEEGDEVQEDGGVKEGVQEDNGSKTHRMLSVLLTDLAHWRYLLTADRLLLLLLTIADRLLLLQIIFTFGKVHRSNCPTADWHQHETASKVNTFWRSVIQNPSQKLTLLQNIIWIMWSTFSLCNDWKISVLSCHHHSLEGRNTLGYYWLCWNFWRH